MNCANHPDVAVVAYCQSCGKPLCAACMRTVGGVVYCEPCLAARLSPSSLGGSAQPNWTGLHAHPVLAGLLGFIPGVGAMYNGQFVKALAHVLIFAVFVSLSDKSFVFGLLVAAWVFYQVFDAAQTAKARRDGLPLPNPFGLNDLGSKLGINPTPVVASPYVAGFTPPSVPGGPAVAADPNPGQSAGWSTVPPPPAYTSSSAMPPPPPAAPGYGVPAYGNPLPMEPRAQKHPLGAIVLIGIGIVLLLHTLGVFEDEWISRAWPVILIGVGGWLLYRRTRDTTRGGSL
jgi:Domain of unknown function (DUF5668)/B-box zinc finger